MDATQSLIDWATHLIRDPRRQARADRPDIQSAEPFHYLVNKVPVESLPAHGVGLDRYGETSLAITGHVSICTREHHGILPLSAGR